MSALWQLKQVPSTSRWSVVEAGDHSMVVWQASHSSVDCMWEESFPRASVSLWQALQTPST